MSVRQSLMAPLADVVVGAVSHVCTLYKELFGCNVSRVLITGYTVHLSEQLLAAPIETGVLKASVPALFRVHIDAVWLLPEQDWHYFKVMGLLRYIEDEGGPLINVYELRNLTRSPRLYPVDPSSNSNIPSPPMLQ